MAILTSSLAAYAIDNIASLTDTIVITDRPSLRQSARDTVDITDSTANNGRSTADTVDITDSTASNGHTTTDTVVITDATGRGTPARDDLVLSDFALPDSVTMDTVALSDSPLVESFIFHGVFASDAVSIADNTAPDSSIVDIVSISDSQLVESFIFYELLASDTVSIVDVASLFGTVLDTIAMADFTSLDSTVLDVLALSDSSLVESFIFYELLASDVAAIADIVSLDSVVLDIVAISDSALVEINIFYDILASDVVAISDAASLFSTVLDTIAVLDLVSLDSTVLDVLALSDSALIESFIFYELLPSDVVAIADAVSLFSAAIDTLDLSDSAALQFGVFSEAVATDIVAIADAVSTFSSVIDIVQITEATSIPLAYVTDTIDIIITSSLVTTKSLIEQLAVGDSFFDIAAVFNRTFSEVLALPDCVFTDESGTCNRVGLASIVIGDLLDLLFSSANNPAEQLSVQDVQARNFTGGRGPAESMQAGDSGAMSMVSPPPSPPPAIAAMPSITMAMTETMGEIEGLPDPKEAVEVGGTWDMDGFDNDSLEAILGAMGMPVYNTSMAASSAGAGDMTMVMPTFRVSAEIDGEQSDDGIFLTPTVSDLPEGMQVMIPISVADSLDSDNLDALGNMTVSFTPAEDAGNFTMLIGMLDNNPEVNITQTLPDGITAFFIDVSFAGDFGSSTPANATFFEEPPTITFTLTEEWALENDVRFSGGAPRISLFLLDETTGEWTEVPNIEPLESTVDGVYTYTATLPHFSTFLASASRPASGAEPREIERSIAESLFITGAANLGTPAEIEGRVVIKDITDSMAIREAQPLIQRVITVHNVSVAVNVVDVRSAGLFGAAVATLNFEITNKGDTADELVLTYWYSNPEGERVYEDSQTITINGGESIVQAIEVPFSSAGVYDLMIEAMAKDQTLASTDIAIEVPWLAANLFLLVIITIVVVAASIGYVLYAMRARLAAGR